jgi:pimeloyl-ACP methyl ester carboxylesterase
LNKLIGLIVAFLASFFLLYALVSKDQPAKHAGLKSADLPPLLAIHDLYAASNALTSRNTEPNIGSSSGTEIGWRQQRGDSNGGSIRLALPEAGPDPGPLPMVVAIESGAASGISADRERTELFLTNRGYAMLSIDCRGLSSAPPAPGAPSDASIEGRCSAAMIRDEVMLRIEQGIADPQAIAVLGSGIGAHLALMTMALKPDMFKAAILHSTVIDVPPSLSGSQPVMTPFNAVVTSGQGPGEGDVMAFVSASPVELAKSIRGAVLITHGKADEVVPMEQAEAFVRALRHAGTDVEAVFFNHEDHRYSLWQTRVQTARLSENFLAHHLGGRNGGYDFIELLAKLF